MDNPVLVFSDEAEGEIVDYCLRETIARVATLSDSKTYSLLGSSVNAALQRGGITTSSIILSGDGLVADEQAIASILLDVDVGTQAIIAVGAGTITDIGRFVSHRLQKRFISVPTAPSVDGYASSGAPIVIKGYKRTIRCHAPEAIFVSLPTLTAAPARMIAAGFGDVVGKAVALADWRLAALLVDARYDPQIADQTRRTYERTVANVHGIARREPRAIRELFDGLTITGDAIDRFGSPEPASGSEQSISRFIEMRRLLMKRPPLLHGAKVAIGTLIAASWYKWLLHWDKHELKERTVAIPEFEADVLAVQQLLGSTGDLLLDNNSFLSTLSYQTVAGIKARLLEHWDEIQEIARQVPEPEDLRELFAIVGAPRTPEELGLTQKDVAEASRFSHYVDSRFTLKTLFFTLGLKPPEYRTAGAD